MLPDLPPHFDGCNAKFSIFYVFGFKKGVLTTTRPNKLCDGVSDLEFKAFYPLYVRDEPLIHPDRAVWEVNSHHAGSPENNSPVTIGDSDQKEDLLIRDI